MPYYCISQHFTENVGIKNDLKDYLKEEHIFHTLTCAYMSLLHLNCNNCTECVQFHDKKKGDYRMCCNYREHLFK
jgi:hypothetical protein